MNVLHVIDSGGLYGAETMLLHLMTEQVQMGLKPILASIGTLREGEKPIEREARSRGLRVKPFRMRAGPNWAGAHGILRFARLEGIDIIHSHGYKGNILFGLLPRGIKQVPIVATLHGWTWVGGISRMAIYEWLDSLSLRFVDRVVLVNEAMREHRRVHSLSRRKVQVVENGIPVVNDVDGNHLRPDIVNFTKQRFTVGSIGRLSPEKGYGLLLEAVASLVADGNDLQCVLLGEGELRDALEKKARALGLEDRALLPGYVHGAADYLPLFGAFVMPSLTEGLPMVLLEAMATGVSIVATRVGGIPGVLDGGQAGILVNPGDTNALCEALLAVLVDGGSARKRADRAAQRVRNLYSSRVMAEKYQAIYGQVLFEQGKREVLA
jgi:glycosyltransferase involved in cell wall biosynthesis